MGIIPDSWDKRSPLLVGAGGLTVGSWLGAGVLAMLVGQGDIAGFGLFVTVCSVFHAMEFLVTAAFRPDEANFDSFCIFHSVPYWAAMSAASAEFWLTRWLLGPDTAWGAAVRSGPVAAAGLAVALLGLAVRYWAMAEAARSFHHIVQHDRPDAHRLVTTGPYAWSRHPSYVGWAVWAVGTQLMLGNAVCAPLYAAASVAFFSARVPGEEHALLRWYGMEYVRYAARVPRMLPLVAGSEALNEAVRAVREAASAAREE